MGDAGEPAAGPVAALCLILFAMAATVAASACFLPHQALWIDETTQLSGLTLSPTEIVHWLTHPNSHDFGVPNDRMPPLAYWLGWLWSRLFGLTEASLRWFGIACTAAAAGFVASAGRLAFGFRAGLFAGLFFALSPNVCVTAVEIRAYPLFLLTSAGTLWTLVSILRSGDAYVRRRLWIALAIWMIAGTCTHFFGALFAGVVLLGLAVDRRATARRVRPVVLVGAAVAINVLALVPFVMASVGMSKEDVARDRLREITQLVYRLIGHPAIAVYPVATVLAFGAAGTLLIAGSRLSADARTRFRFLALMLAAGIAISSAANLVVGGFTAAKVSYATWALPLISVLFSSAFAYPNKRWLPVVVGAGVLFLMSEGTGIVQLAKHGDYFAHGPHRRLQPMVDNLKNGTLAIVHADPVADYGTTYFPLRFSNGPTLPQFVASEDGAPVPIGISLDLTAPNWRDELRGYSRLILLRSKQQSAGQLALQIRGGDQPFGESRLISALEASGEWTRREHQLFVAFVAADVVVLERSRPALR